MLGRNLTGITADGTTVVVSATTRIKDTAPGVYRSDDGGGNWENVGLTVNFTVDGSTNNMKLAIHNNTTTHTNAVYAVVITHAQRDAVEQRAACGLTRHDDRRRRTADRER